MWTGSNHDISRLATRWANGDPRRVRLALVLLLTLRGTPVLYQGDEIGLIDGDITQDDLQDPLGIQSWPTFKGRDPERTPMPWQPTPGGGFTDVGVTPWLPVPHPEQCSVEVERRNPDSVLHLVHDLIELRRLRSDLTMGDYQTLTSPEDVWMYARGTHVVVVLNFSEDATVISGVSGSIALSSLPDREGTTVEGHLTIEPWEALIIDGTPA